MLQRSCGRSGALQYLRGVAFAPVSRRSRRCCSGKISRAAPGIEPGTSRTLSENHATRPSSRVMSVVGARNRANADTVRDRSPAERAAKGAPFLQSTCGLVAMTSASHAGGRRFDPPCAPAPCTFPAPCTPAPLQVVLSTAQGTVPARSRDTLFIQITAGNRTFLLRRPDLLWRAGEVIPSSSPCCLRAASCRSRASRRLAAGVCQGASSP